MRIYLLQFLCNETIMKYLWFVQLFLLCTHSTNRYGIVTYLHRS